MAGFRVYQYDRPETWAQHLEDFQFWLDAKGNITPEQKRGLLMESLDATCKRNLKEWLAPRNVREVSYDDVVIMLDRKITPAVNKLVRYSTFVRRVQKEGKSGSAFMADLRALALLWIWRFSFHHDPGPVCPRTPGSGHTRQTTVSETLTATSALQAVESDEQSRINIIAARGVEEESVHRIGGKPFMAAERRQPDKQANKRKLLCFRCGEKDHHSRDCPKPWQNFKCSKCSRTGHLAKVCRSKGNKATSESNAPLPVAKGNDQVQHTSETGTYRNVRPDEYSESIFYTLASQPEPRSDEVCIPPFVAQVSVDGKRIPFEIDCGATRTLISLRTFNQLYDGNIQPDIYKSSIALSAWGQVATLKVVGAFHAQVTYRDITKLLPVLVCEVDGPNLLGRNWFQPLNISVEGVHHINHQDGDIAITPSYDFSRLPAVTGIDTGCFRGPPIHLELNVEVPPVYQPARVVPFAFTTMVDEAIQRNVERGIWVPLRYADRWATALVVVKKKQGTVRLCGDYRGTVNRALSADPYPTRH